MTTEQATRLALIAAFVDDAQEAARIADMLAQSSLMHSMDPELRGHISIALQHLQMAQQLLAQAQGVTNG
jgi:hypothetical protein